jgi:transcriptional regulator with XRE-family HTH domain
MPTPNDSLRVIRERRCLTVRELASRAGVNPSTVSRIENGHRAGSLPALARIAQVLEVDPELLGGLGGAA